MVATRFKKTQGGQTRRNLGRRARADNHHTLPYFCWPRHDFCAFSAAGSQSTCAASTGCGQVSRMARSLCPTQPNGPRPYRIVSLCHSEGAQSTS